MTTNEAILWLAPGRRAEVLDFFLSHPGRRWTVNAGARESQIPVTTFWKATRALVDLGLLRAARVGGALIVELNQASPAAQALLRGEIRSPHRMAFEAFERRLAPGFPKVRVKLFGSVAKGTSKPQSDVDVLVEVPRGTTDRKRLGARVDRAAVEVLDEFGIVVSPLIVEQGASKL